MDVLALHKAALVEVPSDHENRYEPDLDPSRPVPDPFATVAHISVPASCFVPFKRTCPETNKPPATVLEAHG